jgi:hypothetical protein
VARTYLLHAFLVYKLVHTTGLTLLVYAALMRPYASVCGLKLQVEVEVVNEARLVYALVHTTVYVQKHNTLRVRECSQAPHITCISTDAETQHTQELTRCPGVRCTQVACRATFCADMCDIKRHGMRVFYYGVIVFFLAFFKAELTGVKPSLSLNWASAKLLSRGHDGGA